MNTKQDGKTAERRVTKIVRTDGTHGWREVIENKNDPNGSLVVRDLHVVKRKLLDGRELIALVYTQGEVDGDRSQVLNNGKIKAGKRVRYFMRKGDEVQEVHETLLHVIYKEPTSHNTVDGADPVHWRDRNQFKSLQRDINEKAGLYPRYEVGTPAQLPTLRDLSKSLEDEPRIDS